MGAVISGRHKKAHTVQEPNSEQQHAVGYQEIAKPAEQAERLLSADHKRAMSAALGGNAFELGCLTSSYDSGGHGRLDIVAAQHRSSAWYLVLPEREPAQLASWNSTTYRREWS